MTVFGYFYRHDDTTNSNGTTMFAPPDSMASTDVILAPTAPTPFCVETNTCVHQRLEPGAQTGT